MELQTVGHDWATDLNWTTNKTSGGDGIPAELFQVLKHDAVKVLHSICQQIWKTQQWPQDWKSSVFIPFQKKGNAKECSKYHIIALISHASKLVLKILQARLQNSVHEPRTSRCTSWIYKRQRNQRANCQHLLDYRKNKGIPEKHLLHWLHYSLLLCGSQQSGKFLKELGIPDHLTCFLRNLYAKQETAVRTWHGTMYWLKIEKAICTSKLYIVTLLI